MIVKAKKDRELILIRAQNTQNENKAETIEIEVPEEYESYNKKIVFITTDGTVWDIITNNEYKITNAITKYKQVDFYIWLTKEVNGESIDFRSKTKTLRFYDNIDASDEITPEEIHGVNTVVNLLEEEIEKVENLNIEATKIGDTTTITITKKDGTTQQTVINDGADGQDGRDGKDGDDYVITQQDYQNIANIVEQEINIPSKTSQLQNDSGFITNAVNNLTNYYLKSETYTQTEVNSLIGAISTMNLQVVQTLPTQDISTTTIYLVPKTTAETNDAYDEYIYVSNNWEHIGSTEVDLTGYATESWVNTQISNFLTETEIQQLINTAVNQKYTKPALGIPKTDLASDVQTSLGKADTAIQEHQDISGKEDKTNKVTSIDNTSTDTQYPSAKCVHDSQEEQNTEIEKLQTENARLKATLPTTTGEGEDVTLDKTAEMEFVKPPLPRGNINQAILPTEYQQVEYIESSGGQYIDTGVKGNNNTRADISFRTKTVGNSQAVFGYYVGGYNKTLFLYSSGDKHYQVGYGVFQNLSDSWVDNTKYEISLSNGKIIINGTETTITEASDFTTDENLLLFKISGSTGGGMPIQLYNFKIYNGDTLVRNFIPCYKISNNEIGLYDIVNNVFYTNAGTGTFTKGADAPTPNAEIPVKVVDGEYEIVVSNSDNTESKTLPVSLGNIELCKLGDYQDYLYKNNGKWYVHKNIIKIDLSTITSYIHTPGWRNLTAFVADNVFNHVYSGYTTVASLFCNRLIADTPARITGSVINAIGLGRNSSIYISVEGITTPNALITYFSQNPTYLYAPLATPTDTEITDTTLISQLEEISKTLSYQGQTNITSDTIALFDVEAYQSTKLILQNLDSRLTLVEG